MTPALFDLPLRLGDASALAGVLLSQPAGAPLKPLTDDYRARLAARAAAIPFEAMTPHFPSLERDPVHPSAFYICVDAADGAPFLLRVAPASTPSSGLFPGAILIGRTFIKDLEVVLNAVPFTPADEARLSTFSDQVEKAFQPRAAGSRPVLLIQADEPAAALPAAFAALRKLQRTSAPQSFAFGLAEGQPPAEFFFTVLWAAIRTGWREGYTLHSAAPVLPLPGVRRRPFETDLNIHRTVRLPAGIGREEVSGLLA